MKYTKLLFAFLIIVSHNTIFAQVKSTEADVTWAEEQKESRRSSLGEVIGRNKDGIYVSKAEYGLFSASSFTLEHYDDNMKLVKSHEHDLKKGKLKKFYAGSMMSGDQLYLFTSVKDKAKKKNYFYVQTVNMKTMRMNDDAKKMSTVDFEGSVALNSGGFDFELSKDKSKILVINSFPYKRKQSAKYGLSIFDKNFNKLYSKNVKLSTSDKLFDVQDFRIDNDGNVHVLGKLYFEKRKDTRKGEVNYQHQLLSYYDGLERVEKNTIRVKDKYLNNMQIAIDKNGDYACGGFYSTNESDNVDGTFWLKLDGKTTEVISENYKEFDIDFITQNVKDRVKKKLEKKEKKGKSIELYKYQLDDIIFNDDGGAVLLGEQYYVIEQAITDSNGRTRTTFVYHYRDIIVVKISAMGKIEWAEKIPKRQISRNDGGFYSSYQLSIVKNKLYFIFNDNEKNITNEGDGKLKNFTGDKESLTVLVTMDHNGKQKKERLFNVREAEVIIRPKVGDQIGLREAIIFGQKKKKQRIAKVTFK